MKTSIRKQYVLVMSLLFIGFILVFLVISQFLLDDYYIYKFKGHLLEDLQVFESVNHDLETQLSTIRTLSKSSGFKYVLVDKEGRILLSSVPEFQFGEKNNNLIDLDTKEIMLGLKKGEYAYEVIDFNNDEKQLIMTKQYDASYLVIYTRLSEIIDHAQVANEFFIYVSVFLLLAIIILIYFLSKKVVEPILSINTQVEHIANFDFTLAYQGQSLNELGQLGHNINKISRALEDRITALNRHNHSLEDDIKMQRRFLASIAHEFKSPVGIVKGYAESIKLNYYDNEKEKNEFVDYIIEESDRLSELVEDIIMLAQLDNQAYGLTYTSIDLSGLLLDMLGKYEIDKYTVDSHITCQGDKRRIHQILTNILENALSYSNKVEDIEVCLSCEGDNIILNVSNPSDPISDQDMRQLLKPFYRLEASRSRHTGGHGLGLSIVSSLVEAHHGHMLLSYLNKSFIVEIKLKR